VVESVAASVAVTTGDPASSGRPIARLRDGTPVGAWLLKANPEVWDVLGALTRHEQLDRWRLAWSYRVALVDVGHPCVLWVTGPRSAAHVPGIWAVGHVTSCPEAEPDDPSDPGWGNGVQPTDVRPYVGVNLQVLASPLARVEIAADPRLAQTEVLRRPRMGSPLVMTPDEWAVVEFWALDERALR